MFHALGDLVHDLFVLRLLLRGARLEGLRRLAHVPGLASDNLRNAGLASSDALCNEAATTSPINARTSVSCTSFNPASAK